MLLTFSRLRFRVTKNIFSIFLILNISILLIPGISFAQDSTIVAANTDLSPLQIGLSAGISNNSFRTGQPQTGRSVGYTAGLSLYYNFSNHFGIQLETNFLQQGGQLITFKDDTRLGLPESFSTVNVKNSSIQLNNIEIPVLLKYNLDLKESWVPAFYLGGNYTYTYNATDHYQKTGSLLSGEDVMATVKDFQKVTGQYNRNNFSFIVGADLQLPLTEYLNLRLDFRYVAGLTPVRHNYSYMEKIGFGTDIRANSFISKIGIVLPLKR